MVLPRRSPRRSRKAAGDVGAGGKAGQEALDPGQLARGRDRFLIGYLQVAVHVFPVHELEMGHRITPALNLVMGTSHRLTGQDSRANRFNQIAADGWVVGLESRGAAGE